MTNLEQFRAEVRGWLDQNCPESQRQPTTAADQYWGGRRGALPSEDAGIWYQRMRDKGWVAPEWPREYGGGGLDAEQARVLKQEMKRIRIEDEGVVPVAARVFRGQRPVDAASGRRAAHLDLRQAQGGLTGGKFQQRAVGCSDQAQRQVFDIHRARVDGWAFDRTCLR